MLGTSCTLEEHTKRPESKPCLSLAQALLRKASASLEALTQTSISPDEIITARKQLHFLVRPRRCMLQSGKDKQNSISNAAQTRTLQCCSFRSANVILLQSEQAGQAASDRPWPSQHQKARCMQHIRKLHLSSDECASWPAVLLARDAGHAPTCLLERLCDNHLAAQAKPSIALKGIVLTGV